MGAKLQIKNTTKGPGAWEVLLSGYMLKQSSFYKAGIVFLVTT